MVATESTESTEFTKPSDAALTVELLRLRAENPTSGVQRLSSQLHESNPVRKECKCPPGFENLVYH